MWGVPRTTSTPPHLPQRACIGVQASEFGVKGLEIKGSEGS